MARNPRAAAQRATAKAVREHRTQLSKSVTSRAIAVRENYLRGVLNGTIPEPPAGSKERHSLARAAAKAAWGKADPAYEAAWSKFWYHNKDNWNSETSRYDDPDMEREEDEDYEGDEE